jgi:hypothetical protein
VDVQVAVSQSTIGAVALAETHVACTSPQPAWSGIAVAVGPASFQPGSAQACTRTIGPITRDERCHAGGVTLVGTGLLGGLVPPSLLLELPPPPIVLPPLLPPMLPLTGPDAAVLPPADLVP